MYGCTQIREGYIVRKKLGFLQRKRKKIKRKKIRGYSQIINLSNLILILGLLFIDIATCDK